MIFLSNTVLFSDFRSCVHTVLVLYAPLHLTAREADGLRALEKLRVKKERQRKAKASLASDASGTLLSRSPKRSLPFTVQVRHN
jgi:hypothetical protein